MALGLMVMPRSARVAMICAVGWVSSMARICGSAQLALLGVVTAGMGLKRDVHAG